MKCSSLKREHLKPLQRVSDRGENRGEAKFQRCLAEHKLGLVSVWCTKGSLPRTFTHTCVCAGHSAHSRKKRKERKACAQLAAPDPLPSSLSTHSLAPLLMIKVCLHLWGKFYRLHLKLPHSTHSLFHYISSIKAALARFSVSCGKCSCYH